MLFKVKAEKLYLFLLFPILAKNHLTICRVACGCGGRSLYLCLFACVCKNHKESLFKKKKTLLCVCICVHGRRLVSVHFSVSTQVCPTSQLGSEKCLLRVWVPAVRKRDLPPTCISTDFWISFRQRQMSWFCLLPPLFWGWV